ncbi:MAG: inositol-3-phosphate synthase [Candidatus Bathyarchaeales archaeon]
MKKIRVALVGVGNCASALVQGVQYYKDAKNEEQAAGLKHFLLGGYHASDIEFVSVFDIDKRKVGKDLSEAIFSPPNNTLKLADVPNQGVAVQKGAVLDGVGEYLKNVIQISDAPQADVAEVLKANRAEIVLNLLPSGAVKASEWYAGQALKAKCAFINVTPTPIASNVAWGEKFEDADVPVVGDDLIDQVGATTLHKTLLKLLSDSGVKITETYQLDVGGGTESLDTLERTREAKRTIKTKAVATALPYKAEIVAGSTDFVDFLENRRDSYFWLQGTYFCNVPMCMDVRLCTVDAPNAGSMLFDVIRAVKIALNRKIKGSLPSVSAYAFKNPPKAAPLATAEQWFREFVEGKREG